MDEITLEDVTFKNPIWIAASPLTARWNYIENTIKAGASSIIVRSAADFQRKCDRLCNPCGGKYLGIFQIGLSDGPGLAQQKHKEVRSVFSTSHNASHCDRLTIAEANSLVRKIKNRFGSAYPVINSFAPSSLEELKDVSNLTGDVIELNLRWIKRDFNLPAIVSAYNADADLLSAEQQNKIDAIKNHGEFISKLAGTFLKDYVDRPTLLKVEPTNFADPYIDSRLITHNYSGLTLFDSIKAAGMWSENGVSKQGWGKSSISGKLDPKMNIRARTKFIRQGTYQNTRADMFISGSGGVYDISDVDYLLEVGVNSIQLCSAIYYFGLKQVSKIVQDLENGTKTSNEALINILPETETSPIYNHNILDWLELHKPKNRD